MADYDVKKMKIRKDGNAYTIYQGIPYGECSTGSSTQDKTVTTDFFIGLIDGATVNVKFVNGNTHTAPTLNVNSTGAKPIYKYGITSVGQDATIWQENEVCLFTYDGTGWLLNNYQKSEDDYLLEIDCGTVSSSSTRSFTNSLITSDMVLVNYFASNPSAIRDDWSITTSNGSLALTANDIEGTTSLVLYLMKKKT